jgi:hypothetical protein
MAKYILSITKHIWPTNKQFGFLPNRSTIDAISQVIEDWGKAKDNHEAIFAIFFDFEKAFDLVDHIILLTKLKELLPAWLISWLASYLTERKQRVKIGNIETEWRNVIAGVIQGSVIGPILFILFISDINKFIPVGVELEKYADDILCYILGKLHRTLPQEVIDGVTKWCEVNRMRLNIKKCKVMTINNDEADPVFIK